MNTANPKTDQKTGIEEEILRLVRELKFGVVEIVVHDGRVTEIRQTRRKRIPENPGT